MKTDWKPVIAALVIGIAIGALGHMRCMPFGSRELWKNPEKMRQHMMAEFKSKLNLSAEQQQKISAIMDDTRSQMDALREEMRPKFEALKVTSRARIRELLTLDQQKKFDTMNAQNDARMEKHRAEWSKR